MALITLGELDLPDEMGPIFHVNVNDSLTALQHSYQMKFYWLLGCIKGFSEYNKSTEINPRGLWLLVKQHFSKGSI